MPPQPIRYAHLASSHPPLQELAAFRTDAPYDYRRMHSGAPHTGLARPQHVEDASGKSAA
jgi:hypothetical protein